MKKYTEQQLCAALKYRDTEALKYLIDNYQVVLSNIVIKIVQSEDLTEEVLQDTFLKVWNRIDDYDRSKGRLFTWMLNIARNKAIDVSRSQAFRYEAKGESIGYTVENTVTTQIPHDAIGIADVMASLADELKEVLDWHYFKGFTHQEISDSINLPLGTVKTRLRKAISELRKQLHVELQLS
ncbi:MAG: RNA polymerase sigma factor [Bacteroidota bacterium]